MDHFLHLKSVNNKHKKLLEECCFRYTPPPFPLLTMLGFKTCFGMLSFRKHTGYSS